MGRPANEVPYIENTDEIPNIFSSSMRLIHSFLSLHCEDYFFHSFSMPLNMSVLDFFFFT